jgi:putative tricarboxylic transport membrane protein
MSRKAKALEGPTQRSVEIGVALFIVALGALTVYGALVAGIGWGAEGPKAGFIPFYIGLCILIASAVNLFKIFTAAPSDRLFAEWGQLRQVVSVVIPATVYVFLVEPLGIYVSSFLLIAVFMKWLGGYDWVKTLAIAIGMPLVSYFVFEKWFLVPLPKGPIEAMLGL